MLTIKKCLILVFITLSMVASAEEMLKPTFNPVDNRISCGSKGIWLKPKYGQIMICLDNDIIGYGKEIFNFGKGDISAVMFRTNKKEVSLKNGRLYQGDVRPSVPDATRLGTYQMQMTLLDDGLVQVDSNCDLDDKSSQKNRYFMLCMPSFLNLEGTLVKGNQVVTLDGNDSVSFSEDELKQVCLTFFPDKPSKTFALYPVKCSKMTLCKNRLICTADSNGDLSFRLDLKGEKKDVTNAELSPNGINFPKVDGLHLPDYCSRNLLSNPSFESGTRFWAYRIYGGYAIPLKYKTIYSLDENVAHTESASLKIKAFKIRNPRPLGTFAIPCIPGKKYSVSFYAKGSLDEGLKISVWGRGQKPSLFDKKTVTQFPVSQNWKRYSTSFVAKERFCSIYFNAQLLGNALVDKAVVWLDDVQVEQGEVSEFEQSPVAAQLLSSARGNFLEFGQKPEFKLVIKSLPDSAGEVTVEVQDFFFQSVFTETYSFKTDSAGKTEIILDKLDNKLLGSKWRGVFTVSSEFKIDGLKKPFKDYFRFSIMNFLENKHKNKNMFNLTYAYSLQAAGPEMERFLARERALGFGSITYDFIAFAQDLDLTLDEERAKLLKKYGMDHMGRAVVQVHGHDSEISEDGGKIKMSKIKNRTKPSPEELATFAAICSVKSARRPWNTIWWFTGESNPGIQPLESSDGFAKFLIATYKGIKKGNPNAKVLLEGGPWNMSPEYGTKWVERYLKETKKLDPSITFDGVACHYYRDFPEKPDMDAEAEAFMTMLEKNGCGDMPVYWNEGGNYCSINIPQEGISPYIMHSGNGWYIGPLSYDAGRAERIAAAFSARNWLVGLKYQKNVKCMNDFNTQNRYLDFDFSPRFYEKIPNTLGRILGNASFYKDIRFASFCRCYVFKDDKTGAPIAVIWGHKESVDRWKEKAPVFKFDFGSLDVTCIDLMENERIFPKDSVGKSRIPVTPFPLFVKSLPGTEEALCKAIMNAESSTAAGAVSLCVYPDAEGNASITFKNNLSKDYSGKADLIVNDVKKELELNLPPLTQRDVVINLPSAYYEFGKLLDFSFNATVTGEEAVKIAAKYLRLKSNDGTNITIDGSSDDWKAVSPLALPKGATVKLAVTPQTLFIALEKTGDSADAFAGTGLYLDPVESTENWAVAKAANQDLAVYELQKTVNGSLGAYCHFIQGTQAGSGCDYLLAGRMQDRISIKTGTAGEKQFLELAIPIELLAPLKLKAGKRFGINITLPLSGGSIDSIAPIHEFKSVKEPAKVNLIMVTLCE